VKYDDGGKKLPWGQHHWHGSWKENEKDEGSHLLCISFLNFNSKNTFRPRLFRKPRSKGETTSVIIKTKA